MSLKMNIAYPRNNTQVSFTYNDDKKWAKLVDKRLGQEFEGEQLGDEFKGYLFRIAGGADKTGFALKQGVNTRRKVKLLLANGTCGLRRGREGTRQRKTVRGCIIGNEMSTISLVVVKKGDVEVPGLTDVNNPVRLGPKRANKIRKLFNLPKHSDNIGAENVSKVDVNKDDVKNYVVRRITKEVGDKKYYKAPKITRLVTNTRLRRKRARRNLKFATVKQNAAELGAYKKRLSVVRKQSTKK